MPAVGRATYASACLTGWYDKVDFKEIVRTEGDSWARYLIRMDEIMESLKIIEQLIDNIPEGAYQEKMKPIIRVPEGTYYAAVEGSRGEFGVFLESHGDKTPLPPALPQHGASAGIYRRYDLPRCKDCRPYRYRRYIGLCSTRYRPITVKSKKNVNNRQQTYIKS